MVSTQDPVPNNLPVQLTSFIGREREIAEVNRLLTDTRLVTLTGAGGCGKSRLALQVAMDLQKGFPDGVWVVELAALSESGLVPQAIASALDIPEQLGRPLIETLANALHPKSLLLLLDNCEHLLPACVHLADALLRACPRLRVLATSREPLGVPGETTWRVPSLSVPDLQRLPPHRSLMQYEAIRLFVERAASHSPGFQVTEGNAREVAKVCCWLDGIPLAIELAAARAKALTVEQIAVRLDDRFRFLTGGSRTALPRQRTLRATMDWSHDLLSERERGLLRRLSVFAGGWTLEAAEAVCSGDGVEAAEILDVLTQLVDKSLVIVDTQHGDARYRLLETVRQYGRDRLLESGEAAEVQKRHRDWYLRLAEDAEPRLDGADQAVWLNRLDRDHDNFRAALEWSIEDVPETGLRLAGALGEFWLWRGYFLEGRAWLKRALDTSTGESSTLRAKALNRVGFLAIRQRDYAAARAFCEESLVIYRALGDTRGVADAMHNLGQLDANQADFAAARSRFEESLELYRQLRHQQGVADSLGDLGHVAWHLGDYAMARRLLEESVVLARELGKNRRLAYGLWALGLVAFDEGNYPVAHALHKEGLPIAKEVGDPFTIAFLLEALASLEAAFRQPKRATRLLGAAEAFREDKDFPVPHSHRLDSDRPLAAIRDLLNQDVFAATWAEGRAMTLDQAVEYALAPEERKVRMETALQLKQPMDQKMEAVRRDRDLVASPGLILRDKDPENLEFPFSSLNSFITPNEQFFVRSHFAVPNVDLQSWRLEIEGLVDHPLDISYDDLLDLPSRTVIMALECAGNGRIFLTPKVGGVPWELGAVGNAEWTGVPLAAVLERAGVRAGAVEVVLGGADEGEIKKEPQSPGKIRYARGLPVEKALQPDVILAYQMNGTQLPASHGFPVRAIVPGWYGMASVKWLTRIIVTDQAFRGYFQTLDYTYWHRREGLPIQLLPVGEVEVKAQIARPALHEVVPANSVYPMHGAAWTGESQVTTVEVSTDGGRTWETAQLVGPSPRYGWRLWEYPWHTPSRVGRHIVMARATDARGRVQPMQRDLHRGTYIISHVQPIEVEVQ